MVLVIDTSSALSGLAVLDAGGGVAAEMVLQSGRDLGLPGHVAALVDVRDLTAVAVALGPGSFTGLRVGASYGLGLAMGRGIPLKGLSTLALASERAPFPALGLAEAGRGRVYWGTPGGPASIAEAAEVPTQLPAAGWLRPATAEGLRAAGVRLLDESELRSFGEAAARLFGGAPELGYDTVRLQYMQSFGPLR